MRKTIYLGAFLATAAGVIASCGDDTSSDDATSTNPTTSAGGNPTTTNTGGMTTTGGAGGTGGGPTGGGPTGGGGNPNTSVNCDPADGSMPNLTLTVVDDTLQMPLLIISPPGDTTRAFVIEQAGRVRLIKDGVLAATAFLDIEDIVKSPFNNNGGNEEGLLGLAFHPDYETNGRFFVNYVDTGGDTKVEEYARDGQNPDVASATAGPVVLTHDGAASNHNGGMIEFGPDGFLYISIGDGGGANDPECDAQAAAPNLLGKLSRVDVDGTHDGSGFPAAAGNPDGKIYHNGLRNPWRFGFDKCTGDLYIGDVGQNLFEEVDIITGAMGPLNFGWPIREGAHNFNNNCTNDPTVTEPVAEYAHSGGNCSIAGGYVYRGSAIPGLRGTYFYGDLCTSTIWTLRWDGTQNMQTVTETTLNAQGNILSFGQDAAGEVYVTTTDAVYRIDPG